MEILESYNISDPYSLKHNTSNLSRASIESLVARNPEIREMLENQTISNNPDPTLATEVTDNPSSDTRVSSLADSLFIEDSRRNGHSDASLKPAENLTFPTVSAESPEGVIPIMQDANVTSISDSMPSESSTMNAEFAGETAILKNKNICNETIPELSDLKPSAVETLESSSQEKTTLSDEIQNFGDATSSKNDD